MKYHVLLTDRAEQDAEAVLIWFRRQSAPVAGARWMSRLFTTIDRLETSPERCRKAAEADEIGIDIREITVGRRQGMYRILFQIDGRTVHVLRIWHARRDAIKREDLF